MLDPLTHFSSIGSVKRLINNLPSSSSRRCESGHLIINRCSLFVLLSKSASPEERSKIVDAMVERGVEMMVSSDFPSHMVRPLTNMWIPPIARKIWKLVHSTCVGGSLFSRGPPEDRWLHGVSDSFHFCRRGLNRGYDSGHVVELAANCYGTHVVQKALDCEEDLRVRLLLLRIPPPLNETG